MPAPRRRMVAILVGAGLVAAACGDPIPPERSPASATPTDTIAPTAPAVSPDTSTVLRVATRGDLAGGVSEAATGFDAIRAASFIHDGLYALDARLRPVPRLAAGPATVSPDGRTWTVALRDDVRFHDGTPLTADDVVGMYQLASGPRCPFRPDACLTGVLTSVTAPDPRTVVFTLDSRSPGFDATGLTLGIERAASIAASYETFATGLAGVTASDTADFLAAVATAQAELPADASSGLTDPTLAAAGAAILARAGIPAPDRGDPTLSGGSDDAAYLAGIIGRVQAVDATFTSRADDALAAAYPYLAVAAAPVTSGPYRFAGMDADGTITLDAVPDHPFGTPAIEHIVLQPFESDTAAAAALAAGSVDWAPDLGPAAAASIAGDPAVRTIAYPDLGFYGLTFNLHPEGDGLFLDRNLRQALALCIDRDAAVTDATGADGLAISTEIPPMSWAYPADGSAAVPPDRERATSLIEASGWTLGDDGIYEQGARRLSTVIPVRAGFADRVAWLQSVREDARSCGMDLQVEEVPFEAILRMLAVYPHVNAAAVDEGQPFDAYFGGLDTGLDPDPYRFYHSTECTSAERPDTFNFGCYQDPTVDGLIDRARTETDRSVRADLYRDYATRIATDLPVLYAWSDLIREGIGPAIGTTDPGGLPLDTPTWASFPERLTITR